MALWMEQGSEPSTENERADLDAIAALKVSAAMELKEKGNEYVKMGKKHYSDAIDCYTRAINQRSLDEGETSVLYANRAHVNLILGNHRRALDDAQEAISLCPSNLKAHYRAARAAFLLGLLSEAASFCHGGLEQCPSNEEIKKLFIQIDARKQEQNNREAQISKDVSTAKHIASAIESRGLKLGKAIYQELTGLRKPTLDKSNILHWPVVLLYAEVMSSDFIEDFCETDIFAEHLDIMYSESSPSLPWDKENAYTRKAVELFYQAGYGFPLSKRETLQHLLAGTLAGQEGAFCDGDDDMEHRPMSELPLQETSGKWIRINERKTLAEALRRPDYIIPSIPVFFVVSSGTSFYKVFKAGKWAPP